MEAIISLGEKMKVKDLTPNVRNPRKMRLSKKTALSKSLDKYGDMSGIVFNKRTKRLVGGHQRSSIIPDDAPIVITHKYEVATHAFTTAEGYIELNGERYKYREVDADEKWESEALLSANKHSGEWDNELLRLNFSDFPDMDIEAIGFDEEELLDLGIEYSPMDELDDYFYDKEKKERDDETDEQYIKNNKGPEYLATKERIPNNVAKTLGNKDTTPSPIKDIPIENSNNPFEEAGQKTDIVGKRFVIIIDCKDDAHKKELKEKLRPLVQEAEANFF